jgi:hypothetical protein
MHPRFLALAAVVSTAALLPAQLAGTYVVGPAGNYPNLAAAIAALTTGGVIAPVTFLVTANDSGPWTIPAIAGQGPANPIVFDAQGPITLSGGQPLLTLNGCASVTFRGFSATLATTPHGVVVTGSTADTTFQNCDFRAPAVTSGTQAVFSLQGGTRTTIEDCTFGGMYEALNAGATSTFTTVQRCRITGGGFWIMRILGSDCVIANNEITGNSNYGISCGVTGTAGGPATNLKIWSNSFKIDHNSTTGTSQYCSLRWYTSAPGTEVVNNVLVDNFPAGVGFNMWCSGALRPQVMNNNCFWSNAATWPIVFASANQTLASWQALGFDANSIQADPQYVAPSATPADLRLQPTSPCATAGTFLLSVLTDFAQLPRTVPVSIGAHEQDGGGVTALYQVFGPGCAGTAGVPTNSMSQLPQLGTTPNIVFGNLPAPQLAIAVLGVSNTSYASIPLPVDLGILGAPGCPARVSLDVTLALAGAGGQASTPFPIPNNAIFVGFTFYTQALVFDPPLNALGLSTSDAAMAIVGP